MAKNFAVIKRSYVIAAAAAALLYLAPDPAQSGCSNKSVTLYSAYWCGFCKQVRGILARYHVRYNLQEATNARVQASMLKLFGDTSVPRTVIGGVVVEGVDEARIKQLLCLR